MMLWIYVNEVNKMLAWNNFNLLNYLPPLAFFISRDGVDN